MTGAGQGCLHPGSRACLWAAGDATKALVPCRTVGGLGGAGLSRRRLSTPDAVSAVHMNNLQMPRSRGLRVPQDGLQLGSSGRQLKLDLPRPQALALGAATVPLEEAGQVGKHRFRWRSCG